MNNERYHKYIMSRIERNIIKEKEKKRTSRLRRAADCVVIFACLLIALAYVSSMSIIGPEPEYVYAGGTSKNVPVYLIGVPLTDSGEEEASAESSGGSVEAVKVDSLVRGTHVKKTLDSMELNGERYWRVENTGLQAEADLYMKETNLAPSPDFVVQETEVYARTPATIYAEKEGPAIASFAPKGSSLKVTGYDRLTQDGSVHKYKVEYEKKNGGTDVGFVYGKYMTDTQKRADAVYKKNGIYKKVKSDNYSFNLYGGKAKNLDFYPYEKPVFADKEFCSEARAMYLNCVAAADPDPYIKLIKKTDCNAVVIDIKDGVLAWPAKTAKKWSPKSYKTAYTSAKKYRKGINKLKDTGVYTIGRIVVFNDPLYAKDHPEDCIKYRGSSTWPSAYSRDVWEYNVRLALEAIEKFGFDEIQFDYVRFPENSYEMSKSGKANFRNKYDEEKGQAVQNFCFYAADQIHEAGAYFSVDVFGESAYGYLTAYGQYWPAISNIVDAISAMPYTDHMGGGDSTWKNPYNTMKSWAKKAKKMQDYLENPAAARTWITGYDTPHWDPVVIYGKKQLKAQIQGLEDAGLKGGFIPWNAFNDLSKYKQYKDIWNKD